MAEGGCKCGARAHTLEELQDAERPRRALLVLDMQSVRLNIRKWAFIDWAYTFAVALYGVLLLTTEDEVPHLRKSAAAYSFIALPYATFQSSIWKWDSEPEIALPAIRIYHLAFLGFSIFFAHIAVLTGDPFIAIAAMPRIALIPLQLVYISWLLDKNLYREDEDYLLPEHDCPHHQNKFGIV